MDNLSASVPDSSDKSSFERILHFLSEGYNEWHWRGNGMYGLTLHHSNPTETLSGIDLPLKIKMSICVESAIGGHHISDTTS